MPTASQRLYLHVGLPKSGTSHLQALLAQSRPALREAGFVYPFVRPEGMFHAAVELRGQERLWGLPSDLVRGTWDRLLERVRAHPAATGVISHEILAGASPDVVSRVAEDTAGLELHLVLTARDLARHAVGHWQEEVKNGRPWSFVEFEAALSTPAESEAEELGFWRSHDVAGVLRRWGRHVPASRTHLVTVPAAGSDPGVLQRRFEDAIGLPRDVLRAASTTTRESGNPSLGVAQVALLRQVVGALDGRLPQPAYAHVVKRWFAQGRLAALGGPGPRPPAALAERLRGIASGWVDELTTSGYAVHGDLGDLVPHVDAHAPCPDDVPVGEVEATAVPVIAELLLEVARLRAEVDERPGAGGDGGGGQREPVGPPRRWLPSGRRRG